jgi:hypothetical protein
MRTFGALISLTAIGVISLTSCVVPTTYSGVPVAELSDEQLVQELESALKGFGIETNRAMYLMAIRPEPAYVLTSSTTTFQGSMNGRYNAYSMPTGYGVTTSGTVNANVSGVAKTRYEYTDVRAGAQLGNAIAVAISQSRRAAFKLRAEEVWANYQTRRETRRLQTERLIDDFFVANPQLSERRTLVAVVAPWAAAEGHGDGRRTLDRAKAIIEALPRGPGLTGGWHGMLSQTTKLDNGETVAFTEFVKIDLVEKDGRLAGKGKLGSGEIVELTGEVANSRISAAVANTTSAINVTLSAVATPNQITGEYTGFGAGQRLTGTVVLLR